MNIWLIWPLIVIAVVIIVRLAYKYADPILNWINTPIGVEVKMDKFKPAIDTERLDKAYFKLRARSIDTGWEGESNQLYLTLKQELDTAYKHLEAALNKGNQEQVAFLESTITNLKKRLEKPWAQSFYESKTQEAEANIKLAHLK